MKIILDTNVIIAAFAARGLCNAVFELCLDRFDVVLSEAILEETFINLNEKIKLPPPQCEAIVAYLRDTCAVADPGEIDNPDESGCRDKNDLHVLALAQSAAAEFIVTGDKDLLTLTRYKGTQILTPREFWAAAKS